MFAAAFVFLWLESRPVYLPLGKQQFKVICVELPTGTNAESSLRSRVKHWTLRQFDRIGFHLVGSRGDHFTMPLDQPENWHTVALLCQGRCLSQAQMLKEFGEDMSSLIAECIDEENSVVLQPVGVLPGPPGHVWFVWKYRDADVFKAYPSSNPTITRPSLIPMHLIVMRKVGEKELVRVPITN